MINVEDCTERCYAEIMGQCTVLSDWSITETKCESCKFYKPKGCEDWVRVVMPDGEYLFTPEDYEKRRKDYER